MRTSFNREGGVLSRTFRRFSDSEKVKSAGWQREVLVGKTIEERCTRKRVTLRSNGSQKTDAGSSDKPPRKRDFEERLM